VTPKGYQSCGMDWDMTIALRISLPNTVASPA